jgi:hypothetical protein
MLLKIEENMTIDQINTDLQNKFPHIKLVFFKHKNKNDVDVAETRVTELYIPLKQIYSNMRNAHLNVNGNLQVRRLEQKINEITGTRAQVFRRSGKLWLETLTTDNKTLTEISKMAEESISEILKLEDNDYNEQE